MRSNGFRVLTGSAEYRARDLVFAVHSIPEAVKLGNAIVIAIPDEVQPEVWVKDITEFIPR